MRIDTAKDIVVTVDAVALKKQVQGVTNDVLIDMAGRLRAAAEMLSPTPTSILDEVYANGVTEGRRLQVIQQDIDDKAKAMKEARA